MYLFKIGVIWSAVLDEVCTHSFAALLYVMFSIIIFFVWYRGHRGPNIHCKSSANSRSALSEKGCLSIWPWFGELSADVGRSMTKKTVDNIVDVNSAKFRNSISAFQRRQYPYLHLKSQQVSGQLHYLVLSVRLLSLCKILHCWYNLT